MHLGHTSAAIKKSGEVSFIWDSSLPTITIYLECNEQKTTYIIFYIQYKGN